MPSSTRRLRPKSPLSAIAKPSESTFPCRIRAWAWTARRCAGSSKSFTARRKRSSRAKLAQGLGSRLSSKLSRATAAASRSKANPARVRALHWSCRPARRPLRTPARIEMERLLIVEDDAGVRSTIVNFLELEGYSVDAVSSTREALERLTKNAYPIVISDIYVDDRTGLDVLEAARLKDPGCSVILMNARGTMETVM